MGCILQQVIDSKDYDNVKKNLKMFSFKDSRC